MNNIISFTKLGTVKSGDFELTRKLFFNRMKEQMEINPDVTNVIYNEEADTYTITYYANEFAVYYGNDVLHDDCEDNSIINSLKELIDYKKRITEINAQKEKDQKRLKGAIKNGNKGIFRSEKDKILYIKHLKKQISGLNKNLKEFPFIDRNSNISCFMDIFDKCPNIVENYSVGRLVVFGILGVSALLALLPVGLTPVMITIVITTISLFFASAFNCIFLDRCISIILPIFLLIRYTISRTKEKGKIKSKLNELVKKVTPLEKSLKDPTVLLEEKIVKVNTSDTISQETYEQIKKMIYEARDRIVNINDSKKKNKFGNELSEIIDFERNNLKNKNGIYPQDIINQLNRLSYQIDKEISTEERINNNQAYNEIIEECNKVISYHK